MSLQSFLISDYKTGLEKDVKPYKIMDDAFSELENMYVYRGTLTNRRKPLLLGRLQKPITGESLGTGTDHYTVTLANVPVVLESIELTDAGGQTIVDDGDGRLSGDGTGTINYATGALDVTFTAATGALTADYEYYPLLPVMGINMKETTTTNVEQTIVFDTVDSYYFDQTADKFIPNTTANNSWTGNDHQFFASTNYFITTAGAKYFWATNSKPYVLAGADKQDGIKYYDGATWATLRPIIYNDGTDRYLNGAKIIIPFKGHLILMNTTDEAVNYQNRIRWSGALLDPTGADAWRHDIKGKGGYLDATVNESIQSVAIINDKLIVYFERSTKELAYTGNTALPFILRSISEEYGSESQFSTQIAEGSAITFGSRAITGTDGVRMERMDDKIPKDIFKINNLSNGRERVQSVRDYLDELIYWSVAKDELTYPNKVLIFNYNNGSYAYFDDNYTAMGLFQASSSKKWSTIGKKWSECGFKWSDALAAAETPIVVGGNQRGFVHQFNYLTIDDPSLDVTTVDITTHIITCPLHNLVIENNYYITLTNLLGITGYSTSKIYKAIPSDANTLEIVTDDTWSYQTTPIPAFTSYMGGGSIAVLKPFKFKTKRFNPFIDKGGNIKIGYVDLLMDVTDDGQVAIKVYGDDTQSKPVLEIENFKTSYEGFNNKYSKRNWKRIQVNSNANTLQLEASLTEDMLLGKGGLDIYKADLTIHAMRLWMAPAGKNMGLL